jgi:hypothetical protein
MTESLLRSIEKRTLLLLLLLLPLAAAVAAAAAPVAPQSLVGAHYFGGWLVVLFFCLWFKLWVMDLMVHVFAFQVLLRRLERVRIKML